jgi:hypothetical protein
VQTEIHAAHDRWIGSEVLLHRTSPTVLDRRAALDDAGDRGGPTLGRLPKGVSHERARCLRAHSAVRDIPDSWSLPVNLQTESFRGLDDRFTPPRSGARLPTWLLNNLSPRNRAFGYRRVVTLIGIAHSAAPTLLYPRHCDPSPPRHNVGPQRISAAELSKDTHLRIINNSCSSISTTSAQS